MASMTDKIMKCMTKPAQIRNIAIVAHINHGKTTMTDNLMAGAGMISKELAGKLMVTNYLDEEQKRGITIKSANVSMVHELDKKSYLVNLIDTPGHVDFTGDVTRAMRAVDGCIVIVCSLDGMMPQTETVLKQAVREKVKPILFINKVDRLIRQLKLSPEQMKERFSKIISEVNAFVKSVKGDDEWEVNVQDSSVCFGSTIQRWALSADSMEKNNISFTDVIESYAKNEKEVLAEKAPLHSTVLSSVVKHLPSPKDAQKYRIPVIWKGDIKSKEGKDMLACKSDGNTAFAATKLTVDSKKDIIAGRLFSGEIKKGDTLYLNLAGKKSKVENIYVYKGPQKFEIEKASAGNIIGLCMKHTCAGETISSKKMAPFEEMKHMFEHVVTKAVEAKSPSELPILIEELKKICKEDPSIKVTVNKETGENLVSAMGELHLEIALNKIKAEKGIDIVSSVPIVVYREHILKKTEKPAEVLSQNKKNAVSIYAEPLDAKTVEAIRTCKIPESRITKKSKSEELFAGLLPEQEAGNVKDVCSANIFVDLTKAKSGKIIDSVLCAFEDMMNSGPIAKEKCIGIKIVLADCSVSENEDDYSGKQIDSTVKKAIKSAVMNSKPVLLEPVQKLMFESPNEFMGLITNMIRRKNGQVLDIKQNERLTIIAKIPVLKTFGMSNELLNVTEGRVFQFLISQSFQRVPEDVQESVIQRVRKKKGLSE
jgi:elongation factor 2